MERSKGCERAGKRWSALHRLPPPVLCLQVLPPILRSDGMETNPRRYGNTSRELIRSMIVGLVIGGIAYLACAVMFIFVEHLPASRLLPLTFIIIMPSVLIGAAVASTVIFSIHVDGDGEWIEQRLFGRHVLSRARVRDYQSMTAPSPPFAAVLLFRDGKRIRIWGMHLGLLSKLEKDLKRLSRGAA